MPASPEPSQGESEDNRPLQLKDGDLVWVKIMGHPTWPGQVLRPQLAPQHVKKQMGKKKQSPDTLLFHFYGDHSWGWYQASQCQPFEEAFDEYRGFYEGTRKASNKMYKQAIVEAKEVCDRRAGRPTLTNYRPLDLLDPTTWPLNFGAIRLPDPPTPEAMHQCSAEQALEWLRSVAAGEEQADEAKIAGPAASLVWDTTWGSRILLSERAEREITEYSSAAHAQRAAAAGRAAEKAAGVASKPSKKLVRASLKAKGFGESENGSQEEEDETDEDEKGKEEVKKAKKGIKGGGEESGVAKLLAASEGEGLEGGDEEEEKRAHKQEKKRRKREEEAAKELRRLKKKENKQAAGKKEEEGDEDEDEEGGLAMKRARRKQEAAKGARLAKIEPVVDQSYMEEKAEGVEGTDAGVDEDCQLRTRYWGPVGAMEAAAAEANEEQRHLLLHGGKLEVDLTTLLHWLIDLAKDPLSRKRRQQLRDGGGLGPEAAALLRFKEADQARSNLHRFGEIGVLARQALEEAGAIPPPAKWPLPPPPHAPRVLLPHGDDANDKTVQAGPRPKRVPKPLEKGKARALDALASLRAGIKGSRLSVLEEIESSEESDESSSDEEVEGAPRVPERKRGRKPGQTKAKLAERVGGVSSRQRKKMGGRGKAGRRARAEPMLKPLEIEVQCKEYRDKVPPSENAFSAAFQKWQGEREKDLSARPLVEGVRWNPYSIFLAVANRGGAEAVTAANLWKEVAGAWDAKLTASRSKRLPEMMHTFYQQLLQPFENFVSQKAPVVKKVVEKRNAHGDIEYEAAPAAAAEASDSSDSDSDEQEDEGRECKAGGPLESPSVRPNGNKAAAQPPHKRARTEIGGIAGVSSSRKAFTPKASATSQPGKSSRKYGLDDFDDLDEGSRLAVVPAANKQVAAGSLIGGVATTDMRRLLLHFPPGVRMPTAPRVCVALKRFSPNLQSKDVSFNTAKSIITVDMDTDKLAEKAKESLPRIAYILFPEMGLSKTSPVNVYIVKADDRPPPNKPFPGATAAAGAGWAQGKRDLLELGPSVGKSRDPWEREHRPGLVPHPSMRESSGPPHDPRHAGPVDPFSITPISHFPPPSMGGILGGPHHRQPHPNMPPSAGFASMGGAPPPPPPPPPRRQVQGAAAAVAYGTAPLRPPAPAPAPAAVVAPTSAPAQLPPPLLQAPQDPRQAAAAGAVAAPVASVAPAAAQPSLLQLLQNPALKAAAAAPAPSPAPAISLAPPATTAPPPEQPRPQAQPQQQGNPALAALLANLQTSLPAAQQQQQQLPQRQQPQPQSLPPHQALLGLGGVVGTQPQPLGGVVGGQPQPLGGLPAALQGFFGGMPAPQQLQAPPRQQQAAPVGDQLMQLMKQLQGGK